MEKNYFKTNVFNMKWLKFVYTEECVWSWIIIRLVDWENRLLTSSWKMLKYLLFDEIIKLNKNKTILSYEKNDIISITE